ncbi:MAG TPA: peptidylprolyl isomerase, partial [Eoetvoesiella sp.]
MQKYYEQNKARYVLPARVQLSHILITVAPGATDAQRQAANEKAQKLAKKVAADKSQFADIARAESQDAGTAKDGGKLGWITKGSWPASLENAVFALHKGDVSNVIDGPGGYHIFKVDDVQTERGETFEQAKAKVESEIRRQLGADRFADMASKLTGLVYDNQSSLQPAAEALGLKVKTVDGIAQSHLLSASETVGSNPAASSEDAALFNDVRVRRALFSSQTFSEKQNSGVIEISPDTMVVVRVNKITPAHVQPLPKVTAQIREQLVLERALNAAEKAGQEALTAFAQADPTVVPDDFGAPLTISRVNSQGLDKPILDSAFHANTQKLPAYEGVKGPQGFSIVRIESAQEGKTNDPLLATLPLELSQAWGRAEEQAVLKAMRAAANVKVLPQADKVLAGETEAQN